MTIVADEPETLPELNAPRAPNRAVRISKKIAKTQICCRVDTLMLNDFTRKGYTKDEVMKAALKFYHNAYCNNPPGVPFPMPGLPRLD